MLTSLSSNNESENCAVCSNLLVEIIPIFTEYSVFIQRNSYETDVACAWHCVDDLNKLVENSIDNK
uniref:Uncharacterized protein n=1 Tax=Anguilla anguilla TaxID=7936 RepID=A0A0E9WNM5_ANGAN